MRNIPPYNQTQCSLEFHSFTYRTGFVLVNSVVNPLHCLYRICSQTHATQEERQMIASVFQLVQKSILSIRNTEPAYCEDFKWEMGTALLCCSALKMNVDNRYIHSGINILGVHLSPPRSPFSLLQPPKYFALGYALY